MTELEFTAALAAMEVHMAAPEPFEAVCWEWESDLGLYCVDRCGDNYEATYQVRRLEHAFTIESGDEETVNWATAEAAKRACEQHFDFLRAGMSPSRACAEVEAWARQPAKRPTLRGLAPIVQMLSPKGAWL